MYVVDDYMTRGLSFSVAEALLRKAGAAKVVAIAMGAFGRSPLRFEIDVLGDPFKPLTKGDFIVRGASPLNGEWHGDAQVNFYEKFKG